MQSLYIVPTWLLAWIPHWTIATTVPSCSTYSKKITKRPIFRAGLRHIMDKERTNGDTCCKIDDGIRLNLNRGIRDLGCHVLNKITIFNQEFLFFCRYGIMARSFCKRGIPIKEGLLRISVYSNLPLLAISKKSRQYSQHQYGL